MHYSIFLFKAFTILILSKMVVPGGVPNCQVMIQNYNPPSCAIFDPNFIRITNTSTGYAQYLCVACAPNCQNYQNSGPSKCDNCLQGYVLNTQSQTCEPCSANCYQCDKWGRGTCNPMMCQGRYGHLRNDFYTNNSNSAGTQCSDINCANCTFNHISCQSCIASYALI